MFSLFSERTFLIPWYFAFKGGMERNEGRKVQVGFKETKPAGEGGLFWNGNKLMESGRKGVVFHPSFDPQYIRLFM